ncbi:MAG: YbjQ family protein [Tissierellia bacterium]|nr:YbjQ family protein [Tissierellia bacterium]
MIVTTTNSIEDHQVEEYLGLVFGEVITGVNFLKDIGAGIRDFIGGRSQGYEEELIRARQEALDEMVARAEKLGAQAVIGVKMDYEGLGQGGSMLMVTSSGTAVRIRP